MQNIILGLITLAMTYIATPLAFLQSVITGDKAFDMFVVTALSIIAPLITSAIKSITNLQGFTLFVVHGLVSIGLATGLTVYWYGLDIVTNLVYIGYILGVSNVVFNAVKGASKDK